MKSFQTNGLAFDGEIAHGNVFKICGDKLDFANQYVRINSTVPFSKSL